MIEIVFADSACGSLKLAQRYGMGKYTAGAIGVILGGNPSREEIEEARRRAEEQEKHRWETAVPLDGNPGDVYGFALGLSMGDISGDCLGEGRRRALEEIYAVWNMEDISGYVREKIERTRADLQTICARHMVGEPIRIWYGHNPEELCGLYWLMAALRPLDGKGDIYGVELPRWVQTDDSTVMQHTGWSDVQPGDFGRYARDQKKFSSVLVTACASKWRQLQRENMPLRAVLNGQLVSVPEDIYDSFIRREIGLQEDAFNEARLIGDVIGKHQLGVGDGWIAGRIEHMVLRGELSVVEKAPKEGPVYRRMLKKMRHMEG